jgi:hypothetical protein
MIDFDLDCVAIEFDRPGLRESRRVGDLSVKRREDWRRFLSSALIFKIISELKQNFAVYKPGGCLFAGSTVTCGYGHWISPSVSDLLL